MATYGDIQDRIANLTSRADLAGRIRDAINESVRHYSKRHFWFNTAEDSFVTSNGVQTYTLSQSTTFMDVEQVMFNYNGSRFEVQRDNVLEIRAEDVTGDNAIPSRWALDGRTILFDVNTNGSFTVSYLFTRKYASLSSTADTNDFLTHAEDLITQRSMWWLYAFKTKNRGAAQDCKAAEMEALYELDGEKAFKQASGHVKPTEF